MSPVQISSASQFNQVLSSSTIVVVDFYADWCGPCKAIAPTYESLSTRLSKPKVVTFTKVNVDSQQDISRKYGVTAMPTFMIFRNSTVIETIRGADARKLTSAIENAVRNAGPAKPTYSSVGRTLGGTPANGTRLAKPWNVTGFVQAITSFIGLYLVSLFSLDAYSAAEKSPFNIHRVEMPKPSAAEQNRRSGAATKVGKKLGTISDLSNN